MDQINRLQEMEGIAVSQRSISKNFLQESLKQSVDLPAYITWQTLSTDVSEKLRQGSVRINKSNCLEWAAIEEGEPDEQSHLLDQIVSRQRKTPDSNGASSGGSSGGSSSAYNQNSSGGGSGGYHPTPPQPIASYTSPTESDINANVKPVKSSASNWKVGVFLLVNTALGAGVLNYPAAYDRLGGIPLSTALQLVIILLIASTMLVLIFCAELHNDTTYHDVLRSMCGKRAQQFAASSIMCTCFGINVTFLIIIGDQFDRLISTFVGPDFCQVSFFLHRKFTISAIAVLLIWPCCYFKRLDFLRYVSTLGIFAMIYVVFLNVYEYYKLDVIPGEIKTGPNNAISVVAALPVIFFAYQSHEIVLPIYACLEKPRTSNFLKSTILSLSLLFVIYSLAGSYGYLTFGANVAADIIQSYDARDPVVVAGIFALIIKMVSTYPPLMFCGRGALDGLYAEWRRLTTEAYINGERYRRVVITTFWNTLVLMLAVVTPNITIAIEMLGSLAACNVFIFPGLCMVSLGRRHLIGYYSKIAYERRLLKSLEGTARWGHVWSALIVYGLFIILFGMAMFVIVILQVITDIVRASSTSEANEFGC